MLIIFGENWNLNFGGKRDPLPSNDYEINLIDHIIKHYGRYTLSIIIHLIIWYYSH